MNGLREYGKLERQAPECPAIRNTVNEVSSQDLDWPWCGPVLRDLEA